MLDFLFWCYMFFRTVYWHMLLWKVISCYGRKKKRNLHHYHFICKMLQN